ncbi:MAG: dipeptide ABC transporter ATP-binding protein [Oligosphaeraceae bacterium]
MDGEETRITVSNLGIAFQQGRRLVPAVDGVSFSLKAGEMVALLGESGCGKSLTALSLLGLVPRPSGRLTHGSALLEGKELYSLEESQWQSLRGRRVAMVFQEPMTALNPVMTIGEQLGEVLRTHFHKKGEALRQRCLELLQEVEISDPESRLKAYPHQLSGGLRQRVVIAMALAGEPEVLVADEPTTALDVTVQAQIIALLSRLQKRHGTSVLLITHNLALAAQGADRCLVMYAGQVVEEGETRELFRSPAHPYTRMLLQSLPRRELRSCPLQTIPGMVPRDWSQLAGCRFAPRCPLATEKCRHSPPSWASLSPGHGCRCHRAGTPLSPALASGRLPHRGEPGEILLEARELRIWFPVSSGGVFRPRRWLKAVDGVDLVLRSGETLALVGESGCGKSTVGKALLRLLKPTEGEILLEGKLSCAQLPESGLPPLRRCAQMIFQDPFSSLDPRLMIGESLAEALEMRHPQASREEQKQRIEALLQKVGLSPEDRLRYPHQFSGGQRQRIGLARALAAEPRLILCDECTSALDVSVQAQILNLLKNIQQELGVAYLFITHDLSVVSYLADRVAVMYLGRIVEEGPAEELLRHPSHPYTQALLAAAPRLEEDAQGGLRPTSPGAPLSGEVPSPLSPPPGCPFHPRCPRAIPECAQEPPPWHSISPGHRCRCLHPTLLP